jgi:hypothetical protein
MVPIKQKKNIFNAIVLQAIPKTLCFLTPVFQNERHYFSEQQRDFIPAAWKLLRCLQTNDRSVEYSVSSDPRYSDNEEKEAPGLHHLMDKSKVL